MRYYKNQVLLPGIFRLLLAFLLLGSDAPSQQVAPPGTPTPRRVEFGVAVSPDLAGLEERAAFLLTLTNQNPSSDSQLLPNDVFRLILDLGDGRIESIGRTPIVTSKIVKGSDFLVSQGSGAAEILLTYTGPPVKFGSTDSLAILSVVKTSTEPRTNRVTLEVPGDSRFASSGPGFAQFSTVAAPYRSSPGTSSDGHQDSSLSSRSSRSDRCDRTDRPFGSSRTRRCHWPHRAHRGYRFKWAHGSARCPGQHR